MRDWILAGAILLSVSVAVADTVVLKNGDTLHGKIGQVTPAQLKFSAPAFGEIGIKLDQIASYKIDAPAVVEFKDAPPVTTQVSGEGKAIQVDDRPMTFDTIKSVNPPPQHWTGAVLANFSLARGNTNKFQVGVDTRAALRRETFALNDRLTLTGQYNFGKTDGGAGDEDSVTDTDNFTLFGKYDKFWTQKLYGYVSSKVEHDRIADLDYRLAPNIGVGYQWIETPATNFFTETGIGYTFENYADDTNNDYVTLRFAYHIERALNDKVAAFHNFEYLPALDDFTDYTLNTDIGLKITLVQNFVAQLKVEYKRDSTPADGALKNDLLYLVGLGWQF